MSTGPPPFRGQVATHSLTSTKYNGLRGEVLDGPYGSGKNAGRYKVRLTLEDGSSKFVSLKPSNLSRLTEDGSVAGEIGPDEREEPGRYSGVLSEMRHVRDKIADYAGIERGAGCLKRRKLRIMPL